MFFLVLMMLSLFMLYVSWGNIKKIQFAQAVLEDIHKLYLAGVISDVQAKVFMNDMTNPLDTATIMEVRRELNRIVEAQLRAESKNTDR